MKKFIFGKIFAMMAFAAAVFALAFAGCDDLSDTLRRALDGELKKMEADSADSLKEAFTDPSVKVVEIKDDIDGAKLEKIIVPAGDKTIYIPGGKETAIGSLELSAGSHVKIVNAADGGTAKSVSAALAIAYSEQNYEGWATLVVWDHFRIPDGATFDLIGRTRLVFRTAVVDGKLTAEIKDSILGAGEETPTITGGGKVQTGEVEKDAALAAADIKNSEGHKGPPVPPALDTSITFQNKTYTVDVQPDAENWSKTQWTLNAGEANAVYFAVKKAAEYDIGIGGEDAAKVKQATSGTVAEAVEGGLEATDTLAVFTVDTRDFVFDGGSRSFTLGDVAVTVNVAPNLTGAAVFTVTTGGDGAETLTRVWGAEGNEDAVLVTALTWVENNAEANTEYLLRVEEAAEIPCVVLAFNEKDNVTLRLRGTTEGGPKTIGWKSGAALNVKSYSRTEAGFIQIGKNAASQVKRTLILDNNITVKGKSNTSTINPLFDVGRNATLILRKGAEIKDYTPYDPETYIIYVAAHTSAAERNPVNHGSIRIEGGSITNCKNDNGQYLIQIAGMSSVLSYGAFYKAASTEDNPVNISGNTNNTLLIGSGNPKNEVDLNIEGEISLPAGG
jgi:hypothetical protein